MNIQLTETQCEEVIESIEWIAEEYPQYDDIDKDNHKDIVLSLIHISEPTRPY